MAWLKGFTYDGIDSLDYDLYITSGSVYDAPERVVDMIKVPGRNGNLAIDQGRFENIDVEYDVYTKDRSQTVFAQNIQDFRNELCSRHTYLQLSDDYNPNEFRLGIYKSGLEVEADIDRAGSIKLVFDCKPQRYLTSGQTSQTFTEAGSITNPTLFASSPLIVVTGFGDLGIGSQTLTIEGDDSSQVVYIDCDIQEAWTMSGGVQSPANDLIQNAGEAFPTLNPGSNGISLGGNISSVVITPRWWQL
ncbi:MAG: hypothetical protein IKG04_01945 [Exiguobacterium sp.]|nr:hypothetical protein [Exiguobacterium sp.]